jgi:Tfp pilus assembly protein FimT
LELLAVIGILAVLTAVAGTAVQLTLRAEGRMRTRATELRTLARLARQFRSDARAAENVALGQDEELCRFELSDASHVVYRKEPEGVSRIAQQPDSVRRQKTFSFREGARVQVDRPDGGPLATLRVTLPAHGSKPDSAREIQIDAALGRESVLAKEGLP